MAVNCRSASCSPSLKRSEVCFPLQSRQCADQTDTFTLGEFEVERLHADDLQQDPPVIKASWLPTVGHHSATKEMWQKFVPRLIAGILLANSRGSMKVPGNWNARLPSYRFTTVEKFLTEAWGHK